MCQTVRKIRRELSEICGFKNGQKSIFKISEKILHNFKKSNFNTYCPILSYLQYSCGPAR